MEHISPGPLFHKPQSIVAAKNILYAVLFLTVITWAFIEWTTDIHKAAPVQSIIILVVTLGLVFALIKMIGRGKKWARVVLLILFIAGMLVFPWTLPALFNVSMMTAVLSLFQAILEIVALVFLFSRDSTQWFDRIHEKVLDESPAAR
jgi:hypothetical protein